MPHFGDLRLLGATGGSKTSRNKRKCCQCVVFTRTPVTIAHTLTTSDLNLAPSSLLLPSSLRNRWRANDCKVHMVQQWQCGGHRHHCTVSVHLFADSATALSLFLVSVLLGCLLLLFGDDHRPLATDNNSAYLDEDDMPLLKRRDSSDAE